MADSAPDGLLPPDPAGSADTRQRVLQVARRLFGERGYQAVTIREIAAEVGVSAALVMKVAGTKEQLHADATPLEPTPLDPDHPREEMGRALVRRMLGRRQEEMAEPWLRALYLVADAPDPEAARADFRTRFLGRFDTTDPESRHRVDLLACLLLGLAAGARQMRLLDPAGTDLEAVVEEYGGFVQRLVDGLPDVGSPA